jgi:hypothetical protein
MNILGKRGKSEDEGAKNMAEDKIFALVLTKGGKVKLKFKDIPTAKTELKKMVKAGDALHAYAFKKFAFKVEKHPEVRVSDSFDD